MIIITIVILVMNLVANSGSDETEGANSWRDCWDCSASSTDADCVDVDNSTES